MSIIEKLTGGLLRVIGAFDGLGAEVVAIWHETEAAEPEISARAKPFVDEVAKLYETKGLSPESARALAEDTWKQMSGGHAGFNPNHGGGV